MDFPPVQLDEGESWEILVGWGRVRREDVCAFKHGNFEPRRDICEE